jgi:hypothetical protein
MDDKVLDDALKAAIALRAAYRKLGDELERIEALLDGRQTVGQLVRRLFTSWAEVWGQSYGEKYVFSNQRDAGLFRRLLVTLPPEEVERRMRRYLASDDAFFVKNRHALNVFAGSINQHGTSKAAPALDFEPPVSCRHSPPCVSDAAHTAKVQRELRR